MRIGLLGLHLESAVRNPVASTRTSFRVATGGAVLAALDADGLRTGLGASAPEFVPVWYARARSGGRLSRDDARRMLGEMRTALAAAYPLDGLLLAQHGGLRLGGDGDGEAAVVRTCRDLVGRSVPIVAVYDPHGDPGDAALAMLDGACAFRTAPHVDVTETLVRGTRLVQHLVATGRSSVARMTRGSLRIHGSMAEGPGAGGDAFAEAARLARRPGVLEASWFPSSPWIDTRPGGAGFLVVADDEATALRAGRDANDSVEAARARFAFRDPLVDLAEGARLVAASVSVVPPSEGGPSRGPTGLLLDAGDAIGAGAVGDRWEVAFALVDAKARDVLVAGLIAPELVARCRAEGDGARFTTTLGPELAPGEGEARRLEVFVERATVPLEENEAGLPPPPGAAALVALGDLRVLARSTRSEVAGWSDLERALGSLARWRWLVLKGTRRPADVPSGTAVWTLASPGATVHEARIEAR